MNTEEELQRKIESGFHSDDVESKSYQLVFDALKKKPDDELPSSFADRVVDLVKRKESGSKDYIWMGIGMALLLGALGFALSRITLSMDLGFLSEMKSYTGLFVFAIFFVGLLNWIDKRFISTKQHV